MIAAAAVGAVVSYRRRLKERNGLIWALAAAMGEMESGVRWQRLPVTRLLETLESRSQCGVWFGRVRDKVESGMTLQLAWDSVFAEITDSDAGEILRRMVWNGDGERLTGALGRCREELETLYRQRREEGRQQSRTVTAAALCSAGLVIILLS